MSEPPVPSPCVQICQMSPSGSHCIGCYRTLNEIATWIRLTNEQRRQVLAACDERRQSPGAGLDSGDLI